MKMSKTSHLFKQSNQLGKLQFYRKSWWFFFSYIETILFSKHIYNSDERNQKRAINPWDKYDVTF